MSEAEEARDKGLKTGTEEGTLLDPHTEDLILQEAPITGRTITTKEVTADSPKGTAHPDPLPGGPQLHLSHPIGTMTDGFAAGNWSFCQRMSWKGHSCSQSATQGDTFLKHKDIHHLYNGVPDKEEVMAEMCCSGGTYSVIQPNRVDEAYH